MVGASAETMQRILSQLFSGDDAGSPVRDAGGVQERALKRLLLILVRSLQPEDENDGSDDEEKPEGQTKLQLRDVRVPDSAAASIVWAIGEWSTMSTAVLSPWNLDEESKGKIRLEVLRLLAKSFTGLDQQIKLQAVHMASKVLLPAPLRPSKAMRSP